jgi:hypothetical protein
MRYHSIIVHRCKSVVRQVAGVSAIDISTRLICAAVLLLCLGLTLGCGTDSKQAAKTKGDSTKTRIPLSQLEDMFAQMAKQSTLSPHGPMLWGYFFTDVDKSKLERARDKLVALGYRFVDLHVDKAGIHWLHVERVEAHSPESLHKRNSEFYDLADEYNLGTYDGMDVGPVVNQTAK